MSDWRDVMTARSDADRALGNADAYGGQIEDGRTSDPALAILLAASALCSELRALSVIVDYNGTALCNATGRP